MRIALPTVIVVIMIREDLDELPPESPALLNKMTAVVGEKDGKAVGVPLGTPVGRLLGSEVGWPEGCPVGTPVGTVGQPVGGLEGRELG